MELNKNMCKSLEEVFGDNFSRPDMRLAVMLVRRSMGTPTIPGEIADYTPEEVLPADVLADALEIVAAVSASLDKIKAENTVNTKKTEIDEAFFTARQLAVADIRVAYADRDLAVWQMKRALYKDGDKLPEVKPADPDIG